MVASDRRVSLCETSEGPRAGFPETSLSSFGGSRDAVDEVTKIRNVKITVILQPSPDGEGGPLAVDEVMVPFYKVQVTSSVILRMPPSPSGEG